MRVALALCCAAVAALAAFAAVGAHARYDSSTPGKGEVVDTSPSSVEITFTQEVQRITGTYGIEVNYDRGLLVTSGPAVLDDSDRRIMSVPLQPDLQPGRYVVRWKNVSDVDGDPFEGAFSFYVQTEPNAVDLENDRQLEGIGAEDQTPAASATAGAQPTAEDATAAPATPESGASDDDGGDDSTALVIVLVIAGVAIAGGLGFVAWRYVQSSRGSG
jgi:methionine-rich copper-binding protein CopC